MNLNGFKIIIISLSLTIQLQTLTAQVIGDVYFVKFTDKARVPYSINNPSQFLSGKALNRRSKDNIPISSQDLPVDRSYIDLVSDAGAKIMFITKWMNGIGISSVDQEGLETIRNLPFVERVEQIHNNLSVFGESSADLLKTATINNEVNKDEVESVLSTSKLKNDELIANLDYGFAETQIKMLNGDFMHQRGFLGENITIAVLDNGFLNVNNLDAFDSLWFNNQVISTRDFVINDQIQFNAGDHGAKVLSIMAANKPGVYIGTAPKANYHLIRTEIDGSESLLEEYLWMCGAEYADSVGADIINSSLGYTEFDDVTQNHHYSDMDGNTTIVTRAADIAASKGILVVNSAGNSANKPWRYIGAPADGDSVLAVGAVDENRIWAQFSSIGPTADGRTKPNIVAQGKNTAIIQNNGSVVFGNGTSFSAPIIAGLSACLWQSRPDLNNMQIKESIEKSANLYYWPDSHYGYGLPDFNMAMQLVLMLTISENISPSLLKIFPNPFINNPKLIVFSSTLEMTNLTISDISGKMVISSDYELHQGLNDIHISNLNFLSAGVYIIHLKNSDQNLFSKIIKL
ncbi:MAG: S8 family serine peptidase [Bacteroidetes bacterium]|nr:S8 family serine peptidase [Bacteroidota bacterium]